MTPGLNCFAPPIRLLFSCALVASQSAWLLVLELHDGSWRSRGLPDCSSGLADCLAQEGEVSVGS